MGGKAFNHLNVVRMNKEDYIKIKSKLIASLKSILNTDLIQDLPYYNEKESFGDIDIILTEEDLIYFEEKNKINLYSFLKGVYPKSCFVTNGDITSFALPINKEDYVQVDFMPHPKMDFLNVINYFSFNDLPIIINKFLSIPTFGAVYNMNGCSLNIYRDDGNTEYLLGIASTKNKMFEYLSVLDLDINLFKKGFNTKKEIYEFIYNSKYFDTDYFFNEIEKLNSVEKKRQERSLYNGFIQFVKNKPRKVAIKINNSENKILEIFEELDKQKKDFKKEYNDYLFFKERFNGKNIAKILLLNEKDRNLGRIMKSFLSERMLIDNKKLIEKVRSLSDEDFKIMLEDKKKEILNEKNINSKPKNRIF